MAARVPRVGLFLCFSALSLVSQLPNPALALEQLPALLRVPDELPEAERAELRGVRDTLSSRRQQIESNAGAHNRECTAVPETDTGRVARCRQMQIQLLSAVNAYRQSAEQFNNNVRAAVTRARTRVSEQIKEVRRKIKSDEGAIQRLGLSSRAEDFQEWEDLARDAKAELEKQVLSSAISVTIAGMKPVVKWAGSLTPATGNRMITQLNAAGVNDPYLFDAIRAVANARGKPELASKANEFLRVLEKTKDALVSAAETGRPSRPSGEDVNAHLNAVALVLSLAVKDPRLKFLAQEIEVATAAVYNNVARRISEANIERLTTLTETQLRSLKRLSELLREHVREKKRLERDLARLNASG